MLWPVGGASHHNSSCSTTLWRTRAGANLEELVFHFVLAGNFREFSEWEQFVSLRWSVCVSECVYACVRLPSHPSRVRNPKTSAGWTDLSSKRLQPPLVLWNSRVFIYSLWYKTLTGYVRNRKQLRSLSSTQTLGIFLWFRYVRYLCNNSVKKLNHFFLIVLCMFFFDLWVNVWPVQKKRSVLSFFLFVDLFIP